MSVTQYYHDPAFSSQVMRYPFPNQEASSLTTDRGPRCPRLAGSLRGAESRVPRDGNLLPTRWDCFGLRARNDNTRAGRFPHPQV